MRGRTPEPWLGPELSQVLEELARQGTKRVLVVPVGFVCDHTEILFDIDQQAKALAEGLGIELARTESLNTSPRFIEAVAGHHSLSCRFVKRTSVVVIGGGNHWSRCRLYPCS